MPGALEAVSLTPRFGGGSGCIVQFPQIRVPRYSDARLRAAEDLEPKLDEVSEVSIFDDADPKLCRLKLISGNT